MSSYYKINIGTICRFIWRHWRDNSILLKYSQQTQCMSSNLRYNSKMESLQTNRDLFLLEKILKIIKLLEIIIFLT